jgi:hypothetical protein
MYNTFIREGICPQIFGEDRFGTLPVDGFVVGMRQRHARSGLLQILSLIRRWDFSEHPWNRQHRHPLATYQTELYNGRLFFIDRCVWSPRRPSGASIDAL